MIRKKYAYLSCTDIHPEGWLKDRLVSLGNGLTGNLEEIWDDVGPDNGWLGGNGKSWERGPYYLDGLIPLSLELKDRKLEEKAINWIQHSIESQEGNGFFGPKSNEDWWPRMVILKALIIYADSRPESKEAIGIVGLCARYFHYFSEMVDDNPLEMWAYVRGMETFVSLSWMYEQTGDLFYEELAEKVNSLSFPWDKRFFTSLTFKEPTEKYMPWENCLQCMDQYQQNSDQSTLVDRKKYLSYFENYHMSHGVNIAMAVKYLAYQYQLTGDENYIDILRTGLAEMMECHGQANGMYSCDEHLNGLSPSQGIELCAVVEMMYSLEEIISITGDLTWCDWLEKITYNALETTISQDCCSHQYDQQVNQIACTVDKRQWYNNKDDSNIFGLEPNFGCCTANMHQGWPKFVRSLWMAEDTGYVCLSYAPVSFLDGDVSISVDSVYPYTPEITITVESERDVPFPIRLNIPNTCKGYLITIDGREIEVIKKNHSVILDKLWKKNEIKLTLDFSLEVVKIGGGMSFMYGPLLFALPIEGENKIIVDRGKFSDHEIRPVSPWNFGFKNDVEMNLEYDNGVPTLIGTGYEVPNWKEDMHSAGAFPGVPVKGESKELKLIPFGKTVLRVSVFPILRK